MKKFLCFGLLVLLTGCTQTASVKPITRGISFIADMTFYNESYEMQVNISKNGNAQISMLYPEELKGLIFYIEDDEITAELAGIKTNTPNDFKTTAIGLLYAPFQAADTSKVFKKNNTYFIKGNSDGASYTMYISETGLPLKICDSADRFEILIKNVTIQKEKEP